MSVKAKSKTKSKARRSVKKRSAQRRKAEPQEPQRRYRTVALETRAVDGEEDIVDLSFSSESNHVLRYDYELGGRVPEILLHEEGAVDLSPLMEAGSILRNHDPNQIIGAPVEASIDAESGRGRARIRFGSTKIAQQAKREVLEDRTLRGVSFGYEIYASERIQAGTERKIGAKVFQGPAVLATQWSVYEISPTSVPADSSVGVGRSKEAALLAANQEEQAMPRAKARRKGKPNKAQWATKPRHKSAGTFLERKADRLSSEIAEIEVQLREAEEEEDEEKMEELEEEKERLEEELEEVEADMEEEKGRSADRSERLIRLAERQRVQDIRSACALAKVGDDVADDLIERGLSKEEAASEIIEKMSASSESRNVSQPGDGVETGRDEADKWRQFWEVNLHRSMGNGYFNPDVAEKDNEYPNGPQFGRYFEDAKKVERKYVSLMRLAEEYLERIGVPNVRRMGREEVAKAVFSRRTHELQLRASNTTGDLSNLLGNVAGRVVIGEYRAAKPTWERWCRVGNLSDFKENKRIRISDIAAFRETGENGEIHDSKLKDEAESLRLATYGRKISFSWEMFINDDLDYLSRFPAKLGRGASSLISRLVYTHLLANGTLDADSTALFASDHANYATGSGSALDTAGTALATAITAFRKQKFLQAPNDSGEFLADPIDVAPKGLLVPPELEVTARTLAFSPGSPDDYKSAATLNVYRDLIREVVVEPRLSLTGFHTSVSTTGWYLFGDPRDVDTFEVAFLEGNRDPRIDVEEEFDRLGSSMRAYLPVAVKALDYRGLYLAAGA